MYPNRSISRYSTLLCISCYQYTRATCIILMYCMIISRLIIINYVSNHIACVIILLQYHRRAMICWAKHSRFQPYEVFCGNTFTVHWPPVFITYIQLKIHGKTFAVSSKTTKTAKVYPSKSFIRIESVVVIGTRKYFEVTNLYKLFLSQEMYSSSCL